MIYADKMKRAKHLLDTDKSFAISIERSIQCDASVDRPLPSLKNSDNENFVRLAERVVAHRNGEISDADLVAATHAASVVERNQYMRSKNAQEVREYTQEDYDMYEAYCPELKDTARNLITDIIGYAPDLNYSLGAELSIRLIYDESNRIDPDGSPRPVYVFSRRCAVRALYREAYFKGGWELADQLPLLNFSEEDVFMWLIPKPIKAGFQSYK